MGSWWRRRLVLLILCVLQLMLLPVSHGCFPEERAALLEIHAALVRTNSSLPPPSWGEHLSGHDDCCSWERVTCSNTTRRVSQLHLNHVYAAPDYDSPYWARWSLDTTVFAAFSELQFLDLSNNGLTLKSFDGFRNLSKLRELNLYYNYNSGNIPSFLFSLPHIESLDLSINMFQGPIPITSSSNISLSLKSLRLSYNNLSGRFSFSLFKNLSSLVEINLSGNSNLSVNVYTTGWMPQFQLKRLLLSDCDIDKDIFVKPKFLGTQHQLEYLDLSNNNLSGPMPNWLFTNGSTLIYLGLRNNFLTGSLGPILYPQTSLQGIDVNMNHIGGQLPANVSSIFPSLTDIEVSNNNFFGEIPMSLCHINQIENLFLSNNNFSGEMPACLFSDLPNLWELDASDNYLSGPILGGWNNLSVGYLLFLANNKFEGALPRNLSGDLQVLVLHGNNLTGELDASSWNLSSLDTLDVSSNSMTGEIHPQICALSSIKYLDLSNNQFTGSIRSCNNSSLEFLNVSMNLLSADIFLGHFNMPKLIILDAGHNMLMGNLSWVHHLPLIMVLSLRHNNLHGHIPSSLCKLRYLRIIDLSHNKISGPVPPCVGVIPFFQDASLLEFQNSLYYALYFTVSTKGLQLTYYFGSTIDLMSSIDLSKNSLSGEIPQELGKLSRVKSLNLSHNALIGPIPASLANMIEVESLDLSHNELTGEIPRELNRLHWLEVFLVAYNRLSGCVPRGGQFGTFDADSYEGNLQLEMNCSSHSPAALEPSPVLPPRAEMMVDRGTYAASAASFVLAFWSTVAFSFYHPTGRRMVLKL